MPFSRHTIEAGRHGRKYANHSGPVAGVLTDEAPGSTKPNDKEGFAINIKADSVDEKSQLRSRKKRANSASMMLPT
jgi:hypothetical protein